jgi:hypothetical protein
MTLIYASQNAVGAASGILFTSALNTNTNTWKTAPVTLMGADSEYVTQVYGELGSIGSPELLYHSGIVFLQAAANGLPGLFVSELGGNSSKQLDPRPSNTVGIAPVGFTIFNGKVYFNGTDSSGTHWLYEISSKGEAIEAGASLALTVTPFNAAAAPANPTFMRNYNGSLFMNALGANNQNDLFPFNGTFQPAVEGDNQNQGGLNPTGMAAGGNHLFFNGVDASNLNALYAYNGSGTAKEACIKNHGSTKAIDPIDIKGTTIAGDSVAFFSGVKDSAGNRTIFKTIASPGGGFSTKASENDVKGPGHSVHNLDPYDLTLIGTDLYFTGNLDDTGNNRGLFLCKTGQNTYSQVAGSSHYNFNYDNIYNPTWGDLNNHADRVGRCPILWRHGNR